MATVDTSGRAVVLAPLGPSAPSQSEIRWSAVTGAVRYILQVDNLTTGESSVIRENHLTTTSYIPASPFASGDYRTWVRAISDSGDYAPWSLFADFSVS